MANTFKNATLNNVGTTATTIYTCPASTTTVVIGFTLANILGTNVTCRVSLHDGTNLIDIVPAGTPIPSGSSLIVAGGEHKIVLTAAQYIEIAMSVATSGDGVISVLEMA